MQIHHLKILCLILVIVIAFPDIADSEETAPLVVGMRGEKQEVVLPAPELEVKPLKDGDPFILRITRVSPHGTAFRYDFSYYALEPRIYNLCSYLQLRDGSPPGKLPVLEVKVVGLLEPGLHTPHPVLPEPVTWVGRYWHLLLAGSLLWLSGLLMLLFWGRKKQLAQGGPQALPRTVADQLRPLILRARNQQLTPGEQAELERTLLAFWRRRLHLDQEKAPQAMAQLRSHPEAGILLNQLELWLHRPGTASQVDVNELLKPYQQIDSLDGKGQITPSEVMA